MKMFMIYCDSLMSARNKLTLDTLQKKMLNKINIMCFKK